VGEGAAGALTRVPWPLVLVSLLLYTELLSCCVDFIVLEGDNLAALFPNASLHLGSLEFSAQQV
jgi:vesicular inhibitory amino acid transporter